MTDLTTNLFAEVSYKPGFKTLSVRLIGPNIGQRETTIIQQMVGPAIHDAAGSLAHLVLDLSAVTFMNSTGLGMLVDFRTRTLKAGGPAARVLLVGVNPDLLALLKMVKFDKLFTTVKDPEELSKAMAH